MATTGIALPLVFSFRRTLFGTGFVVEVKANHGRALCVHEDDGVWLYGVNPGGMAARGDDEAEARAEFARTFTGVLKQLAQETKSFDEFRDLVRRFFDETNVGFEPDWVEAVRRVREDGVKAEGLPQLSADAPRNISIEIKAAYSATDNDSELESALAA